MNQQPRIPNPQTAKRLLANLHRTHLEMEEFNLELDEINAKLEEINRQKRRSRLKQLLENY